MQSDSKSKYLILFNHVPPTVEDFGRLGQFPGKHCCRHRAEFPDQAHAFNTSHTPMLRFALSIISLHKTLLFIFGQISRIDCNCNLHSVFIVCRLTVIFQVRSFSAQAGLYLCLYLPNVSLFWPKFVCYFWHTIYFNTEKR